MIGDTIDLVNIPVANVESATVAGSTLTVDIRGGTPLTYTVTGVPSADGFLIGSDNNGGTDLILEVKPVITVPGAQTLDVNEVTAITGISVATATSRWDLYGDTDRHHGRAVDDRPGRARSATTIPMI